MSNLRAHPATIEIDGNENNTRQTGRDYKTKKTNVYGCQANNCKMYHQLILAGLVILGLIVLALLILSVVLIVSVSDMQETIKQIMYKLTYT